MRTACTLILLIGALALGASTLTMQEPSLLQTAGDREIVTTFSCGFEEGADDWTTYDGTSPYDWYESWTLSTAGAYSGNSWWMHDPSIDGYNNTRYITFDTPDITLPTDAPQLSFRISYAMEDTGGTGSYDAWDAVNVRVSNDEGETWHVVSGSPAYDASNVYAFGEIFGEGEGVPGWTGQSDGWVDVSISLSQWTGQSIRVRFAFASDEATCTADDIGDPNWFGVRLDDIDVAGVFASDGDGATGDEQMMTGLSGFVSGDYWELDNASAHTGAASMHCPNIFNLRDELISPHITLDNNSDPTLRYWARLDLPDVDSDNNGCPDDYLEVMVKGSNDPAWTRLHWLSGEANANWRMVGPGVADIVGDCDLSDWAGRNIQIKFVLVTDDDNDDGQGAGVWIDDVNIGYETTLLPPENLAGQFDGQSATLAWQPPGSNVVEGWIFWDDGVNYDNIGINASGDIDAAIRFDANDLAPYVGGDLTHVRFFPNEAQCEYTIRLWTGANATLAYEQAVDSPTIGEWNEVELNTPYAIISGAELWIGYLADTQTGHPCGTDDGPSVYDKGGWIRLDNGPWEQLLDNEPPLDYNWNIQGYVTAPDGRELPLWPHQPQMRDDVLSGYIVQRGDSPANIDDVMATLSDTGTTCNDDSPVFNDENFYTVRAWYNGDQSQLSAPSNFTGVFAPSATMNQLAHDDNVADSVFTPLNMGEMLAVMFEPQETVVIRQLEVYLEQAPQGLLPVRIWGLGDGEPGETLLDFAVLPTWLHTGWNVIDLPYGLEVNDSFFAGVIGTTDNISIGLDDSDRGYSFVNQDGWTELLTDELMIRAWVDTSLPTSGEPVPEPTLALANYPNPFNPETTVRFSMSEAGPARLDVYNLRGQHVTTLLDDTLAAGDHTVTWRPEEAASGVYLLRLQAGGESQTRKAVLLK